MATAMKKVGRGIATAVTVLVMLAMLALFVLFIWPNSFNIMNGSMAPTIPVGAKVFVVEQDEYQPGDIITFDAVEVAGYDPLIVTHRLTGFNPEDGSLITQGDANDTRDYAAEPIFVDDVYGKVVGQVPFVGGIQMWLKDNILWAGLALAGALLLILVLGMKPRAGGEADDPNDEVVDANTDADAADPANVSSMEAITEEIPVMAGHDPHAESSLESSMPSRTRGRHHY